LVSLFGERKIYEKWLKSKIVSLSLLALCLSVWRRRKWLKGKIVSLSASLCCLVPIAICQCFVEEEDKEWRLEGTKMDVDGREN
jgi:hypothetical protein